MSGGVVSDRAAAEALAAGFITVVMYDAVEVAYPVESTIGAIVSGCSLGNSLKVQLTDLKTAIDTTANNLVSIADTWIALDHAIAKAV